MSDISRRPIREHLRETVAALAALQTVSPLAARHGGGTPSETLTADYNTVLAQLEKEAMEAIAAAAAEIRKPTVGDLVDRLWEGGPLTFRNPGRRGGVSRSPG